MDKNVKKKRNARGAAYEEKAAALLVRAGLSIECRNFRGPRNELDIVARQNRELVFVEVRYRSSNKFGHAYETVRHEKQRRIIRAARSYLAFRKPQFSTCRFDVVAFTGDEDPGTHFADAFRVEVDHFGQTGHW